MAIAQDSLTARGPSHPEKEDDRDYNHGYPKEGEKEDDRSHDYGHPQGRGSEYLAQRIAESSPEIHESLKRGEYPSVRSAAIASVRKMAAIQAAEQADPTLERNREGITIQKE